MGIFTRFRDIVSSNINAMLDKAEDPEKLINLMIREMEDTLVEIKASCAGVMANAKKLAVSKSRDDLAREALVEKRRFSELASSLERELTEHNALIDQYQADIQQLEDKLRSAREKQRILVQRHNHARNKKRAQEEIRRIDSADAVVKFEEMENRIERMEAEADLVNMARKPALDADFEQLMVDEDIEKELQRLKSSMSGEAE
jgi:phage shock protein A